MTTNPFTEDHPQRRPYHMLVGTLIFTVAYAVAVAVIRVTLMPR